MLSENYEQGQFNSTIFFNQDDYEFYCLENSDNLLYRKPMTAATVESLPLIDLRDFGAPSGIGRVWHALAFFFTRRKADASKNSEAPRKVA